MPDKYCIAILLLAALCTAQPLVNAPLLPRYNYLTMGENSNMAISVGNWVFGATSAGFYAMNGSMPTAAPRTSTR